MLRGNLNFSGQLTLWLRLCEDINNLASNCVLLFKAIIININSRKEKRNLRHYVLDTMD